MEDPSFFCGACGAVFDMEDIEQEHWDDLHCPECGAADVAGTDDLAN